MDRFLGEENIVAIDYETTGFDCYKSDKIFAFVVTNTKLESRVYRFDNTSKEKNEVSKNKFRHYHQKKIQKVAHNAKFEMGFTEVTLPGTNFSVWHDTYIMAKMLNNILQSYKLEKLSDKYFKDVFPEESEKWEYYDAQVKKHMTTQKRLMNNYQHRVEKEILEPMYCNGISPFYIDKPNYGLIPVNILKNYISADGVRCMLLYLMLFPKIKKDTALHKDYLNEIRLLETTRKMEQHGMMLHKRNALSLIDDMRNKLDNLETQKKKVFGFDINLNSSDQLQKHLFGFINKKKHQKLDQKWKKVKPAFHLIPIKLTATHLPSASADDLNALINKYPNNPALDIVLKHRAWSKSITMIESYIDFAKPDLIIHPTTNTNKAATGRQSVSNPNLQNVSKAGSCRSTYGIPGRVCFRPRPGYVFLFADYAGIEMRLIIAASGEQYLIDKLNEDSAYDVHTDNGIVILGDELKNEKDKVRFKLLRAYVKDATFGRCYGANLPTFAQAIHKTPEQAQECFERFGELRPGLFNFTKNMMEEIKKKGYITNAFGRKFYAMKDYFAANYRIQSDAGGILKRAENNIDEYIINKMHGDYDLLRMIMTVHDEIIFEMHRSLLPKINTLLKDLSYCMSHMPEIAVPLEAEWKISSSTWHNARGMHI